MTSLIRAGSRGFWLRSISSARVPHPHGVMVLALLGVEAAAKIVKQYGQGVLPPAC